MSNARKRGERARARAWKGPKVAPETARRLAHLETLRTIAVEEKRLEERDANRVIPVGGSGRRREKARRNARAVYDTELTRRVDRLRDVSPLFAFPRQTITEYRILMHDQTEIDDLERRWEFRACAVIDPNVRVRGNETYTSFEDCTRVVFEGEAVRAVELEDGIETNAIVTSVDRERGLIYLEVDWSDWRDVDDEKLLDHLRAQDRQNAQIYQICRDRGISWKETRHVTRLIKELHGVEIGFDDLQERVVEATRAIDDLTEILAEANAVTDGD